MKVILKTIIILLTLGNLSCKQKEDGTAKNPFTQPGRNWGELTKLKENLYESDYNSNKRLIEKITFLNNEKYYTTYTDQISIIEKDKSVSLSYSYVIDIQSYRRLKGSGYAIDKNRVYFLDTTKVCGHSSRVNVYHADPKTFTATAYGKGKDNTFTFERSKINKIILK